MKQLILVFLITFISNLGCEERERISYLNKNKFNNIVKSEIYGDTLKIETEKITENNYIEHYIDLKGTIDDKFDGSYNANIFYYTMNIDTNMKSGININLDKFQFIFDRYELIELCKLNLKQTSNLSSSIDNEYWRDLLTKVSRPNIKSPIDKRYLKLLLPKLKFSCNYNKTTMLENVIMYDYKTEFSGGYNINGVYRNDTVIILHKNEYMN